MNMPSCQCQYCMFNFHCPNCFQKPSVRARCRKEEEEREQMLRLAHQQAKKARDAAELKRADEIAEGVAWLFTGHDSGGEATPSEGEALGWPEMVFELGGGEVGGEGQTTAGAEAEAGTE